MRLVELHPLLGAVERFEIGDVVDEDAEMGVLEVTGDEAFESFLPRCVPELQAVRLVAMHQVFD
jgi:hypothetical protein